MLSVFEDLLISKVQVLFAGHARLTPLPMTGGVRLCNLSEFRGGN